jgi:hypothetical protein
LETIGIIVIEERPERLKTTEFKDKHCKMIYFTSFTFGQFDKLPKYAIIKCFKQVISSPGKGEKQRRLVGAYGKGIS